MGWSFIAAKMEGQVAQFAMRPEGIVLSPIIFDNYQGRCESPNQRLAGADSHAEGSLCEAKMAGSGEPPYKIVPD